MTDSSSKPRCQLRKCRVLNFQVVLETQGDGFCSVKSLAKITFRLF
jgi:hypothetical protein